MNVDVDVIYIESRERERVEILVLVVVVQGSWSSSYGDIMDRDAIHAVADG